jgi:hypothetical protein
VCWERRVARLGVVINVYKVCQKTWIDHLEDIDSDIGGRMVLTCILKKRCNSAFRKAHGSVTRGALCILLNSVYL